MPETARDACRFVECGMRVGAATIGYEQCRNWMPRVALQETRSAVVAGYDHDRWIQFRDAR